MMLPQTTLPDVVAPSLLAPNTADPHTINPLSYFGCSSKIFIDTSEPYSRGKRDGHFMR